MNKKSLIYGFVSLTVASAVAGVLTINRTQAQIETQPQTVAQNPHHPGGQTSTPSGMGMMNKQQLDQHFIEMMIPHHQGAIDMANLALNKAKRPEIRQLAEAIKKDQNREIEEMKGWYKQWYGTEVPAGSTSGMPMSMPSATGTNSGTHQGMSMNSCTSMMGMMGTNMIATDLTALKNASDFDKTFVEEMIPHHKMAVMMAGMVLDSNHPEIRNLAKSIIQTQSAEIEKMRQWSQT